MKRLVPILAVLALFIPAIAAAGYGDDCVDEVYCRVEGSAVVIEHVGAWYNCCPVMQWTQSVEPNVLRVEETEVEGLCDCMCCFDYGMSVSGLQAGEWTVVFAWIDSNAPQPGPREEIFTVEVPAAEAAADAALATWTMRDCYDPSTAGIADREPNWGMIKAMFR